MTGTAGSIFLVVQAPNGEKREYPLTDLAMVIGRDDSADIRVDDRKVSRRHASFRVLEGQAWVEDLGSINGLRLNGKKIKQRAMVLASDVVQVGSEYGHIIDVPGHTVGHIAFYFPDSGYAFTADSLMAGGCGRLFEGTPDQMWQSLSKLMALPPETLICSGHEYTAANLRFAASVDPENQALKARIDRVALANSQNRPTVPSRLSQELATNPFLRANDPHIKAILNQPNATDAETFAALRALKDKF